MKTETAQTRSSEGAAVDSAAQAQGPRRCGHVAIVGRPNVGKSTLLNRLVGARITPVADKPQTSWHNISGIVTRGTAQIVLVDTPGIHVREPRLLNRVMNTNALGALESLDVVLFLVEALQWGPEDAHVLNKVQASGRPCVIALTKVDRIRDKGLLLPFLQRLGELQPGAEIVPISAQKGTNLQALLEVLEARLPAGEFIYPEDQLTSRSTRFIISELIREQLVRALQKELPYAVYVEVERVEETDQMVEIDALILVERSTHRGIVIGHQGRTLRHVGSEARKAIKALVGQQAMLKLWVKDKAGWRDDPAVMSTFEDGHGGATRSR